MTTDRATVDTETFTLTFNKYELNLIFRGLRLVEERCSKIEEILEKDFTKEFHTQQAGWMNERGAKIFDNTIWTKAAVGSLISKLQDLKKQ